MVYSFDDVNGLESNISADRLTIAKEEKEIYEIYSEKGRQKHTYKLTIVSMWLLGIMGLTLLTIRIYHFLTPVDWQWLDINQMQTLDKMLFSGTIGSILGKYSGSIFFKEK